jgi:hypothetical protein
VEENEGLMLQIKPAVFREAKWREQWHWICQNGALSMSLGCPGLESQENDFSLRSGIVSEALCTTMQLY